MKRMLPLLLATLPVIVHAQTHIPKSSISDALPPNVQTVLASVTSHQTLFPISGDELWPGPVIKADIITFAPNSNLILEDTDDPVIVIAAKEIRFTDKDANYHIRFKVNGGADGPDGADGQEGAPGTGDVNYTGGAGAPGAPG